MKNQYLLFIVLFLSFSGFAQDVKRCEGSEPTYIQRMPGFLISECKNSEYNEKDFVYYDESGKAVSLKKAGKYYSIWYRKDPAETRKISNAQIIKNYADAFLKVKGKVYGKAMQVMSASINGKEVTFWISNSNSADCGSYNIFIVESEQMQQDISINMEEAIDKDGKATLYGILFDVGKSDIKPESADALKQIVDYLNAKPEVKVIIVGHTDNTGAYAANITLSKARAESIKNYLVSTGKIAGSRLISEGVGQACPVSTNSTEEGRKLNRRVEIVKQ